MSAAGDVNLVVLRGRLAAAPEKREFDGGSRLIRFLVTVKTGMPRRRVDVVPVTLWDPSPQVWDEPGERDDLAWVVGAVQRRFWEGADGRRSRLEVIAEHIALTDIGELETVEV